MSEGKEKEGCGTFLFGLIIAGILWSPFMAFMNHRYADAERNKAIKAGVGRWTVDSDGWTAFEYGAAK